MRKVRDICAAFHKNTLEMGGNRYFDKPQELNSLIQFCNANEFKSTLVTSIDKERVKETGDLRITFVPSALYAFNIGENTLKMKNTSY